MQPDVSKYRHHMDGFDLSIEQKDELLRTLWRVLENFVDRAFGIDSAQISQGIARDRDSKTARNQVKYENKTIAQKFTHAADNKAKKGGGA